MNGLIALCHFCEVHGPSVVLCTQPYSNKYSNPCSQLHVVDKSNGEELKNYIHNNKLFNLYEVANQNNSASASKVGMVKANSVPGVQHQSCPACTSIGKDGIPLVSNDHAEKVTYMSSQSPEDNGLFTLLRHACIRSLTCEITPGEDGAIYFGEENNAHVISYRFKLQNALARGLRSTYSIVVISKDKLNLLNLWPFLVPNLKLIVTRLQEAAQAVNTDEQAIESTRAIRLANPELHPALNHRTRPGDKEPRSLLAITRQDNVFQQLHSWFTWLLRVSGSTYKLWHPTIPDPGEECSRSIRDIVLGDSSELESQVHSLIQLYLILGRAQFSTLVFHLVVGNQIIVRAHTEKMANIITQALSILLPLGCVKLGYSRIIYYQVFQYNLLGLDVAVPLSHEVTNVDADPCVVLLVTPIDGVVGEPHLSHDQISIRMDSSKPPIAISLSSPIAISSCPRIVKHYTDFLEKHQQFSAKLMLINLEIVLNEWLQKSELYFAYKRKQTGRQLTDAEHESRLCQFLRAVGVPGMADHAVLRFWLQGMSDEYRRSVLEHTRTCVAGISVVGPPASSTGGSGGGSRHSLHSTADLTG